jgi:superfamily I DNA and/or RNA helicase
MGGASKSNEGQAQMAAYIASLLHARREDGSATNDSQVQPPGISALTPYSKQVKALHAAMPSKLGISAHTIDSFQGREDDIILFSTVRCNAMEDIGFVEDARRLNVAWTRARQALVIIGDKRTLTAKSSLWMKAIESCMEVSLIIPG